MDSMKNLIESRKTAILYRQLARSERHTQEAEEKKREFLQKLRIAEAGEEASQRKADQAELSAIGLPENAPEARQIKSVLNGVEAENKRNQLMVMLLN